MVLTKTQKRLSNQVFVFVLYDPSRVDACVRFIDRMYLEFLSIDMTVVSSVRSALMLQSRGLRTPGDHVWGDTPSLDSSLPVESRTDDRVVELVSYLIYSCSDQTGAIFVGKSRELLWFAVESVLRMTAPESDIASLRRLRDESVDFFVVKNGRLETAGFLT